MMLKYTGNFIAFLDLFVDRVGQALQRMNQTSKELYNFNDKTFKKMFNKLFP